MHHTCTAERLEFLTPILHLKREAKFWLVATLTIPSLSTNVMRVSVSCMYHPLKTTTYMTSIDRTVAVTTTTMVAAKAATDLDQYGISMTVRIATTTSMIATMTQLCAQAQTLIYSPQGIPDGLEPKLALLDQRQR